MKELNEDDFIPKVEVGSGEDTYNVADSKEDLLIRSSTENTGDRFNIEESTKEHINIEMSGSTQKEIYTDKPDDWSLITAVKVDESGVPPRIDTDKIQNESQALYYFITEVKRRFRLEKYDNMLEKLEDIEIEDAIYDSLEEINQYTPISQYTLLQMIGLGSRYRRLLIIGAGKYAIQTLVSEWVSNGMDINIEDASISNKLSDFQSLFETLKTQFDEGIEKLKNYDRIRTINGTYSTGRDRYGYNSKSFVKRVFNIYSNGGRI